MEFHGIPISNSYNLNPKKCGMIMGNIPCFDPDTCVPCNARHFNDMFLGCTSLGSYLTDLSLILTEDTLGVTIKTLIVSIRDKSVLILTMVRQNGFEVTLIPLGATSYDLTSQFERLA